MAGSALLLLPRALEGFILRDQAENLLRRPGVEAAPPGRVPYGAYGRMPERAALALGARVGRALRTGATPRVLVIFHPLQWPVARGFLDAHPGCELWYGRWDRYEAAYDAGPALRERLRAWHEAAAARAAFVFAASGELARQERDAGREAEVVGLAADSFPAPDPGAAVIAVSLGHHGRRTDWTLVRRVLEAMPELILMLVGETHADECRDDPDFAAAVALPGLLRLGRRTDEEAARLILCADVGCVPFKREPFNDAGLPYRILKHARLGRLTICPDLAGVRTWDRAVVVADGAEAWIETLRRFAGARARPDEGVREWALLQTAEAVNAPLRERLAAAGVG